MEYDDLGNDEVIKTKLRNFQDSIKQIGDKIELAINSNVYNDLSIKDKVNYDLFMVYSLNTLYWMYLRTKNQNPKKNDLKGQLTRIKSYMIKRDQAIERNTIRPKLDQKAAKRFVKHGINYKKSK